MKAFTFKGADARRRREELGLSAADVAGIRKRRTPPPVTREETAEARRRSGDALAQARARDAEVRHVARSLRRQRAENHFARLISEAFREARP
ncbi:hypothetical protein ACFPZ0_24590 [Streptomonospora nanhaiensis]|uniref:DUF7620 family protein n=1 Tax=Streptomonospora nanhaiensis TaxID=1323731 RepID=UPI001C3936F0|nr:hypothetical protein [Streptomonospora nanhaiensis]MBV2364989.1 hypothetical protein [Streptomonospora nanhaiensis]MBX9391309.1 hypothetical protein [Streptomonospora nanhaiensis]